MKILKTIWKYTKSFLLFWQDFLVGDSPELAVGVLIILGTAYLLRKSGGLGCGGSSGTGTDFDDNHSVAENTGTLTIK